MKYWKYDPHEIIEKCKKNGRGLANGGKKSWV
jgi:hypothetical protein